MSTPDMTLGELGRRIDALMAEVRTTREAMQVEVRQTRIDMTEHNRRFESEFLRKSEFEARQSADVMQLRGLESEVHALVKRQEASDERRRTDRALIISAFVAPLVVAVFVALLLNGGAV
jgi:hypothetical protein